MRSDAAITLPACSVTTAASIAESVQHRSDVRLSRHVQRIHARKNRRVTGGLNSVETSIQSIQPTKSFSNSLFRYILTQTIKIKKGKGSMNSITERRVPELIPILGSQPAGDMSHES